MLMWCDQSAGARVGYEKGKVSSGKTGKGLVSGTKNFAL